MEKRAQGAMMANIIYALMGALFAVMIFWIITHRVLPSKA